MLKTSDEIRKVRCTYGERSTKLYTFLCDEDLYNTLNEGDLVVVDSKDQYAIVKVVSATSEPLDPNIFYKKILRKL